MRKIFLIIILLVIIFSSINFVSAQGMMGFSNSSPDNATIQSQRQEEQEGKNLLEDLSNKTVTCSQLKDADFEKIGEYFMGQSIEDTSRHIAMNEMMKSMMGEQGEEQMHTVMGKRMSNCEPNAPMPQNMMDSSMMGMMNMMGGGMVGNYPGVYGYGNYSYWNFFLILLLVIVIILIAWLVYKFGIKKESSSETPFSILKKRFAKGELTKKQFEDMRKDLEE